MKIAGKVECLTLKIGHCLWQKKKIILPGGLAIHKVIHVVCGGVFEHLGDKNSSIIFGKVWRGGQRVFLFLLFFISEGLNLKAYLDLVLCI